MKGGRRKTTWKPKWKSGRTTVIRVPEVLVPELIRVARYLDDGGKVILDAGKPSKSSSPDAPAEPPKAETRPPKAPKAKRMRKEKEEAQMDAKRR